MSHEIITDSRAADAELLTRVGIALTLRQRHALRAIDIEVADGTVTLSGEVPTFYDRQLAFAVTRRVAGVRRIRDELSVANRSFAGWERVGAAATGREDAGESLENPAIPEKSAVGKRQSTQSEIPWETGWLAALKSRSYARRASQSRRAWGLLVASLILLTWGCGKPQVERTPVFPVAGTITFKGQPVHGAIVALHPKNAAEPADASAPTPRASVDKDGKFTVTTFESGDGAPAGDYVLTILWYKLVGSGFDVKPGPNVIPTKYAKAETSNLEIKVAAGQNKIPPINL